MFVFTAKLNRRKAVLFLIVFALVIAAVILAVSLRGTAGERHTAAHTVAPVGIRSPGDAAAYLTALGWEVDPEPLEVREIVIPRQFSGVYADYAALQKRQGLPLEQYCGKDAVRYTFRVRNYPTGESDIVADLVVSGQTVIAGDIQSTALDGFMTELRPSANPGI